MKLLILFFLSAAVSVHADDQPISSMTLTPTQNTQCPAENMQSPALCQHKEKILESGISEDALKQALAFKARNPLLDSPEIMVADYSKNSREQRLYRINLETGKVVKAHISHGGGYVSGDKHGRGEHWGDRDHDGMIDRCKVPDEITRYWRPHLREQNRENMTRPGFYATKRPRHYVSNRRKWVPLEGGSVHTADNGIPMQGLTDGVNSDAEEEMVALNAPLYNDDPRMGETLAMGRGSHGPAIRPRDRHVFRDVPVNTIFYAYVPVCEDDMDVVLAQVPGWENMCSNEDPSQQLDHCRHIENQGRSSGKTPTIQEERPRNPNINGTIGI